MNFTAYPVPPMIASIMDVFEYSHRFYNFNPEDIHAFFYLLYLLVKMIKAICQTFIPRCFIHSSILMYFVEAFKSSLVFFWNLSSFQREYSRPRCCYRHILSTNGSSRFLERNDYDYEMFNKRINPSDYDYDMFHKRINPSLTELDSRKDNKVAF